MTVGSFSKTYWGGLRTGWVRAPEGIIARLAAAKAAADLGSPSFQQAILATLVRDRHEEILRGRADWTRDRYAVMASALSSLLPDWRWSPARRADDLGPAARRRRLLSVRPGRAPARRRRHPRAAAVGVRAALAVPMRLAFVRPPSELAVAMRTLAAVQPGASSEAELSRDHVPTRKLTTR